MLPGCRRYLEAYYEVKKTTINPSQLATTPTAEYELINISGRNS